MTQPSNLSPTDREKVLAVYPDAEAHFWGGWRDGEQGVNIKVGDARSGSGLAVIGSGETDAEAWSDAASRIPSPASPDEVSNMEITDRQLCLLSQLFNRHGHEIPNTEDQFSINKWIEKRIAEARNAEI